MEPKTIVCFGDSNTHGTLPMATIADKRRLGSKERWPGVAAEALGDSFNVIEEGLPGRTTLHDDPIEGVHKNGLLALKMVLESHDPIDLLIIMLGTNDLKCRFSLPASDIAIGISKLLELVAMHNSALALDPIKTLIVAPPPILETGCLQSMFKGGAKKSSAFKDLFRNVANGHSTAFLDAGSVIQSSPIDGVHFEHDQHERLGDAIADLVSTLIAI